MFLITTADQQFWKKDEKILFLGEWCKIYNQKNVWSDLDYEVLPYHWDNREKLYHDYLYLDTIYEKYLNQLTEKLNNLHNVNYSNRYWRIVVGPWLNYFIGILFDRYLSIKVAIDSGLVTNTWIFPKNIDEFSANNFSEFQTWSFSDHYNCYIYSRIIETLGEIPYEIVNVPTSPKSNKKLNVGDETRFKRVAKQLTEIYGRCIPSRLNQVVFVTSYLSTLDLIKLQLSMGQLPYPLTPNVLSEDSGVISSMRKRLILKEGKSEFESILNWFIAEQMPKTFVENYADMHQLSLDAFPKQPKLIFTANAYFDEGFQLWAAYNVEHSAKLIGTQHGGHYGSGLWTAFESHQINICDSYYTWGWQTDGEKKTIPFSTGKFAKVQETVTADPNGYILWVNMSIPRYSYWMYSAPEGPQMLEYLNDQHRFVKSVSDEVHDCLLLRLYSLDYGWNEVDRWGDKDSTLKLSQGKTLIYQQLNKSRLFVGTYNSTTYLETFSANFPTILFWNPKHWELRQSAIPYFDKLRKVGILHDTPESAARKLNEIYKDPKSWWNQIEVQEAKDEFCYQFARTSDDWLKEWKNEFSKMHAKDIIMNR